jgi:hypothetical protein
VPMAVKHNQIHGFQRSGLAIDLLSRVTGGANGRGEQIRSFRKEVV